MSGLSPSSEELRRKLLVASAYIMQLAGTAAALYASPHYWKQPYHTSALTGAAWVQELINGHPDCIHNELGMHLHVFVALVYELQTLCGLEEIHISLLWKNKQQSSSTWLSLGCLSGM